MRKKKHLIFCGEKKKKPLIVCGETKNKPLIACGETKNKHLIVCCDGTWQKLSSPYPTNVVKIAQAIKPSCENGISQIVFYDEGVGSGNAAEKFLGNADRILGGAFGLGIDNNIQNAYRFLCLNYDPGDDIYL